MAKQAAVANLAQQIKTKVHFEVRKSGLCRTALQSEVCGIMLHFLLAWQYQPITVFSIRPDYRSLNL